MKTRESVLAATDLSAPSRHAVARAFRIAARADCELHVLHVLELDALDTLRDFLGVDLSATKAALQADAHERLTRLAADPGRNRGIAAQTRIILGVPLTVVGSEADAMDAGLVVLGARGESFLRHALLGSTAVRLLRKSTRRPVLVVKQPPHEDYRNVLVPVDFSPASLLAIREARRWASGADLVLLHAFELPYEGKLSLAGVEEQVIRQYITAGIDSRRRKLHELAASAGLTPGGYLARVIHGDPIQQIITLEQEYDADLIVVGKHGTHITEDLLLGSVTKNVLAEAQGDVLIVAGPRSAGAILP